MNATTPTHHPVEPDSEGSPDESAPNPSQLPIQPEFGPVLEPVEPEDPGVKPPHL